MSVSGAGEGLSPDDFDRFELSVEQFFDSYERAAVSAPIHRSRFLAAAVFREANRRQGLAPDDPVTAAWRRLFMELACRRADRITFDAIIAAEFG